MPNAKIIGSRLLKLRGDKSQTKVANDLGVSQNTVASWETGIRIPRDELKKRIADYYQTSVQTIFFD